MVLVLLLACSLPVLVTLFVYLHAGTCNIYSFVTPDTGFHFVILYLSNRFSYMDLYCVTHLAPIKYTEIQIATAVFNFTL